MSDRAMTILWQAETLEINDCTRQGLDNLLEAFMERGVRDALGVSQIDPHDLSTARVWLHSDSLEPWSFLWAVKELNLSCKFVKRLRSLIPRYSTQRLTHADIDSGLPSLNALVN